jgi:hypothetical protein
MKNANRKGRGKEKGKKKKVAIELTNWTRASGLKLICCHSPQTTKRKSRQKLSNGRTTPPAQITQVEGSGVQNTPDENNNKKMETEGGFQSIIWKGVFPLLSSKDRDGWAGGWMVRRGRG